MSTNPHRLPRTVVPTHYELNLAPDTGSARFSGSVVIELEVNEPVTTVVCNAIDLVVHTAVLVGSDGTELHATTAVDTDLERVTFTLPAGQTRAFYRLALSFSP